MHPTAHISNLPSERDNLRAALRCVHSRISANTAQSLEAAAFLYALVDLLEERGLITIDELDARKRVVGERLAEQYRRSGRGVLLQDPEEDKYAFAACASVDCAARLPVCKAACCRLPFALSRQDLNEGVVRGDLEQPYLIEQAADGYCGHLEQGCLSMRSARCPAGPSTAGPTRASGSTMRPR